MALYTIRHAFLVVGLFIIASCQTKDVTSPAEQTSEKDSLSHAKSIINGDLSAAEFARYDIYASIKLSANLDQLSSNQKEMVKLLIEAGEITDELFWQQVWGDKESLLNDVNDARAKQFAIYNYGPWDRLDNDQPFISEYGPRPAGANFYPKDMTEEEFKEWGQAGKDGLYSLVRRDTDGELSLVPYSRAYGKQLTEVAHLLKKASKLAEDSDFANYLNLRATALLDDEYQASDFAWMDMKNNPIELVIGPIETYQDALFGYRAAFETFVLIKDQQWSDRLSRFVKYMPQLQRELPVEERYKAEVPGSDSDLNAYDLIYCAGDCNSGAKTIAINLPNDEQVQLAKGTRRLQLKNAMSAKFEKILDPIADFLITPEQRKFVTFDAFFANTMFHEVAHGLGIKNTLDGKNTVRQALKSHASALEEGKADILGLYMIQKLRDKGEISEGELMDNYVTFLAGIFRSIRFGASSAHGKANMIRFNYFSDANVFSRDADSGTYSVNVEAFEQAIRSLSSKLLQLQGDGDFQAVDDFVNQYAQIKPQLRRDLDKLAALNIPVDIVYEQGIDVLGL